MCAYCDAGPERCSGPGGCVLPSVVEAALDVACIEVSCKRRLDKFRCATDPARFRRKTADILGRRAVTAITLTVAAGLGLYFHLYEGGLANQLFVWSATLLIAAWIVFAARRVLVAAVLIVALIVILDRAGTAKLKAMSMAVHAYDVVFYLTSWSTLSFLWVEFPSLLAALAVAISGAGTCCSPRLSR